MSSTLFTANNLNSRQESSEGLFTLYKSPDNSRSFNLTNPNLVNVFPSPLTTPPMNNPPNQHVSPKHLTDNKNKTFIETLDQANLSSFSSYYYLISRDDLSIDITSVAPASHLPNDVEAIAHLKLLKCFGLFKKKVLGDAVGNEATTLWKAFVTNSVRRFIIFATALRKFMMNYNLEQDDGSKISKNPAFVSIMAQLMPPLDVILVWHSFILNSKSFYDVFVRSNMLQFANFPLPLHKICQFIDNHTFEFVVPHEYKHNYLEVLKCFTKSDIDLRYDVTDSFDYTQHYVTVSCPNCYKKLSDPIVLCNGASGFADSGLKCKNIRLVQDSSCYCSWIFLITHSELRKLQLYSDAMRSGILQGTFKFSPSEVILSDPIKSSYKFKEIFDKVWNTNRFKSLEHILQILKDECDKYSLPHTKLLQSYSKFNMISMTVPGSVELGEDLVEMVLKQDKFTTKMNNLNWLHSSNIDHIAYEGCSRYTKFYTMLTNAEVHKSLRPTLDIELMWLTHQLCAFGYYKDCLTSSRHCIIDQSDNLVQGLLDDSINLTAKVYKDLYNEEYLICYCEPCTYQRRKSSVSTAGTFESDYLVPPVMVHSNSFDATMLATPQREDTFFVDQVTSMSDPSPSNFSDKVSIDEVWLSLKEQDNTVNTAHLTVDYFSYPSYSTADELSYTTTNTLSPTSPDGFITGFEVV